MSSCISVKILTFSLFMLLQNISLTYIYQQSLTNEEINQKRCNRIGFENATRNIGVLFSSFSTQLAIYPFSIYPFGEKHPVIHFLLRWCVREVLRQFLVLSLFWCKCVEDNF